MNEVMTDTVTVVNDSLTTASNEALNKLSFNWQNIIDGQGFIISATGYVIVFIALYLLYLLFTALTKVIQKRTRTRLQNAGEVLKGEKKDLSVSGEINAAIAMALHLHFAQVHDFENTVLTIKKVQRPYSPWNSKIYGLRTFPKK